MELSDKPSEAIGLFREVVKAEGDREPWARGNALPECHVDYANDQLMAYFHFMTCFGMDIEHWNVLKDRPGQLTNQIRHLMREAVVHLSQTLTPPITPEQWEAGAVCGYCGCCKDSAPYPGGNSDGTE